MTGQPMTGQPILSELINNQEGPQPARALISQIASLLDRAAIDNPRFEARLLLAIALGRDDMVASHEDVRIGPREMDRLAQLVQRRSAGEPPSRLRGWREFYGLRFDLNAQMLDPRPDSEILVEAALEFARQQQMDRPVDVADFGTGSGCLLLSVLYHLAQARGVGLDISQQALDGAAANAQRLGLAQRCDFIQGSWERDLPRAHFDIILANPPYIALADRDQLAAEVRLHDPHRALFGGPDGLDHYSVLLPVIAARLAADGRAFVEIGADQADRLTRLAGDAGLTCQALLADLAGRPRCLVLAH